MNRYSGSLDANIVLRLLLNDVTDQHQAVLNLLQYHPDQFIVSDTAIIEVVFVLERHYTFPRSAICEAINGLATLPQITCNHTLIEKALPLFIKHITLSFEDCCLAIYAELNKALPLWTFDQKLARQVPSAQLVPS